MARTKRSRRSYGAGEWGRNRVRVFPDPKTGLFQIEWRENGRRLTRSLKHRDWARAKRQADEFAAGFVGPKLNGRREAEPEPLTLERLFDIYGEEVTPSKGERARRSDKVAMRTFLQFFGGDRDPATLSQRDWDRFIRERRAGRIGTEREARGRPDDRMGPHLPDRGPQLGRKVQGRARPPTAGQEPAQGPQEAQGEEPHPGRPRRGRIPSAAPRVPTNQLAVPRRARARARDRTPDRRDPPTQVVGYRPRRRSGAVAREAREDGLRTQHAADRRGARCLGRGATDKPGDRGRPAAPRAEGPVSERKPLSGARLVGAGRGARRTGAQAGSWLALAQAQVRNRPYGPAAQGPVRTRRLEERADGAQMLSEGR